MYVNVSIVDVSIILYSSISAPFLHCKFQWKANYDRKQETASITA